MSAELPLLPSLRFCLCNSSRDSSDYSNVHRASLDSSDRITREPRRFVFFLICLALTICIFKKIATDETQVALFFVVSSVFRILNVQKILYILRIPYIIRDWTTFLDYLRSCHLFQFNSKFSNLKKSIFKVQLVSNLLAFVSSVVSLLNLL